MRPRGRCIAAGLLGAVLVWFSQATILILAGLGGRCYLAWLLERDVADRARSADHGADLGRGVRGGGARSLSPRFEHDQGVHGPLLAIPRRLPSLADPEARRLSSGRGTA
jgi:hypothetical protein